VVVELTVEAAVVVVVEEVVEVFLAVEEEVVDLMVVLVESVERIYGGKKLVGVFRAIKEDKTVVAVAMIEFFTGIE
jgi:hypothetical protein